MGREVKVCPKCHSRKIDLQGGNPMTMLGGVTPTWVCHQCGYNGPVTEVDEDELEEEE